MGSWAARGVPGSRPPNIDSLYAESTSFSDFHVSPTCSPTRSALMTGNVPFRNGVTHTGGARSRVALSAIMMPQIPQEGRIYVWHLRQVASGTGREISAQRQRIRRDICPWLRRHWAAPWMCPTTSTSIRSFATMEPLSRQRDSARTCSSPRRWPGSNKNQNKPFFAYISTNAPHGPFIAPPANSARFKSWGFRGGQPGFYGMIENIDENVGRLIAHLKQWNMEENTLVVSMSDNGFVLAGSGVGKIGTRDGKDIRAYNAGLKGGKKTPHEGGTRVPVFFRWRGVLQEGVEVKALAAHIDILPTFVDLAGGTIPAGIDGKSLVPLLEKTRCTVARPQPLFPHRTLGTAKQVRTNQSTTRRQGSRCAMPRYRLVNNEQLHDISSDLGERTNLYAEKPEVAPGHASRPMTSGGTKSRPCMVNEGSKKMARKPLSCEVQAAAAEGRHSRLGRAGVLTQRGAGSLFVNKRLTAR